MSEKNLLDFNIRPDLEIISCLVEPGSRVLDLGCGDGSFLRMLKEERQADVLGLEISQEKIATCIANGVPVIQSDLDNDLEFADDDAFDLVIVSQTLQETRRPDLLLKRIIRVGRQCAVSVINFGYISCRIQLLLTGRMPRNRHMPYQWYDTPNIHFSTIKDFRVLCKKQGIRITDEIPVGQNYPLLTAAIPNLFAVGCVFVIEKA